MEGKVHPADPCKVLLRKDPDDEWTACDNIFGEFDHYLTDAQQDQRASEPFYLYQVPKGG